MAKAANGKGMHARRKKRYERINPVLEQREQMTQARIQHSIAVQSGIDPGFEPPTPQHWSKEIAQTQDVQVHDRQSIEEDVEKLKSQYLPY